jgi:hypothetical protein
MDSITSATSVNGTPLIVPAPAVNTASGVTSALIEELTAADLQSSQVDLSPNGRLLAIGSALQGQGGSQVVSSQQNNLNTALAIVQSFNDLASTNDNTLLSSEFSNPAILGALPLPPSLNINGLQSQFLNTPVAAGTTGTGSTATTLGQALSGLGITAQINTLGLFTGSGTTLALDPNALNVAGTANPAGTAAVLQQAVQTLTPLVVQNLNLQTSNLLTAPLDNTATTANADNTANLLATLPLDTALAADAAIAAQNATATGLTGAAGDLTNLAGANLALADLATAGLTDTGLTAPTDTVAGALDSLIAQTLAPTAAATATTSAATAATAAAIAAPNAAPTIAATTATTATTTPAATTASTIATAATTATTAATLAAAPTTLTTAVTPITTATAAPATAATATTATTATAAAAVAAATAAATPATTDTTATIDTTTLTTAAPTTTATAAPAPAPVAATTTDTTAAVAATPATAVDDPAQAAAIAAYNLRLPAGVLPVTGNDTQTAQDEVNSVERITRARLAALKAHDELAQANRRERIKEDIRR